MLERLFTSRTRVKLLTLFLMNPEREMYFREIVRKVSENVNSVRRELANLQSIGLLKSRKSGNLKFYRVNRNFPIYEELLSIFMKYGGVAEILKGDLETLGRLDMAFIYGSFARGDAASESDIDLFLVGDVEEESLIMRIRELEKKLSREINYVLFTPEEFRRRIEERDSFVMNVLREPKIDLIGDVDAGRP